MKDRDGYALRFCMEKLLEQETERKMLIRISDGWPEAKSYSGAAAASDIKQILKELDRNGIAYIAAAIGSDKEAIERLYGPRHFLDCTDLNTLPMAMAKLIKRLIR